MPSLRMRMLRGFTMIELMVVVGIIGLLATLATPNMLALVNSQRARSGAESVMLAINGARGLSQRMNEPIVAEIHANGVRYKRGDYGPGPHGFLMSAGTWTNERFVAFEPSVVIDGAGTFTPGSTFAFCPSGDHRFVDVGGSISPLGAGGAVCGAGDMASASGTLVFSVHGEMFELEVMAPLATLRLHHK